MIYDFNSTIKKIDFSTYKRRFQKKHSIPLHCKIQKEQDDIYYIKHGEAYAIVEFSRKGNFAYISDILSFKKFHGRRLIEHLISQYQDKLFRVIVNQVTSDYFTNIGFVTDFYLDNYYEMSVSYENLIKTSKTCEFCRFYAKNKCQTTKESKSNHDTCDGFYDH
jgi:hypothetical protein